MTPPYFGYYGQKKTKSAEKFSSDDRMARGGGFEPPWDKSHWISNPTQWPDYATPARILRLTGDISQLR